MGLLTLLGRKGWSEDGCLPGLWESEHKPLSRLCLHHQPFFSEEGELGNKYTDDCKVLKRIKHLCVPVKFLCPYTQPEQCSCHLLVPCAGHNLGLFRAAENRA